LTTNRLTDRQTKRQTDRWTGPLHEAALAVARGLIMLIKYSQADRLVVHYVCQHVMAILHLCGPNITYVNLITLIELSLRGILYPVTLYQLRR